VTNLIPETTYYYKAQSIDLSDNKTMSGEKSFTTSSPETYIFLPLTLRR
jgi:hypothetical protein